MIIDGFVAILAKENLDIFETTLETRFFENHYKTVKNQPFLNFQNLSFTKSPIFVESGQFLPRQKPQGNFVVHLKKPKKSAFSRISL